MGTNIEALKQDFEDNAPRRARRVYIGPNDDVPDPYEAQEDEEGLEYYVPEDDYFIDYQEPAEKRRVYVDSPDEVPEQYTVQEGNAGGLYYETDSGSSNLGGVGTGHGMTDVRPGAGGTNESGQGSPPDGNPMEWVEPDSISPDDAGEEIEVSFEYDGEMYTEQGEVMDNGSIGLEGGGGVLEPSDLEAVRFNDENKSEKRRVYVEDPNQVPDQYNIQEGAQGGYFYETDTVDTDSGTTGTSTSNHGFAEEHDFESMTVEALEEFRSYLMDQHQAAREDVSTASNDDLMRDILDVVMELDEELMERQDDSDPCWEGYEQVGMKEGENGEMVPNCVPKDDKAAKQAELEEGLTWGETVRVIDIDEDAGEVRMMDELAGTEWIEDIEDVRNKLELLPEQEHDYVYSIVADHYPELEPEDVHEMLHEGLDMEVDTTDIEAAEKRRVYIGDPSEAPEDVNVEEGDQGGYYYETDEEDGI